MTWRIRSSMILLLSAAAIVSCSDDGSAETTGEDSTTETSTGDGDGDPATGDGDGDTGDGDGDTGDGDGDTGDGDGDTGDGDGDTGDGDGDTGDGDGDTGDGDGDAGDGDTGDGLCNGTCGTPNCGPCPEGPAWVEMGDYAIHSTEVANSQYTQFLDIEFSPEFMLLPDSCNWKQDFTPDGWDDAPAANLPVRSVDWCDATAYCAWAGGHLCGGIGGGPTPGEDVVDPNVSEWYRACTNVGLKEYPYGQLYQPMACNSADAGFDELLEVGSLDTCEGGVPGIYDMSGNAWEWANSCDDDPMLPPNEQQCRRRGGSYFSDGPVVRCGINSLRNRDLREVSIGFRCCQ